MSFITTSWSSYVQQTQKNFQIYQNKCLIFKFGRHYLKLNTERIFLETVAQNYVDRPKLTHLLMTFWLHGTITMCGVNSWLHCCPPVTTKADLQWLPNELHHLLLVIVHKTLFISLVFGRTCLLVPSVDERANLFIPGRSCQTALNWAATRRKEFQVSLKIYGSRNSLIFRVFH